MGRKLLTSMCLLIASFSAEAQKGNNQIQISGQVTRPTSDLLEVTNIGYGGAIKGMYGFGDDNQQATLEGGYNHFPVKNLPSGVEAYYSAIPLYAGYRYLINRFSLEAQAGVSLNRIVGRNSQVSLSSNETDFAWALGVGYVLKGFEIAARYQNSNVKDSDDNLTFLALRLAYNIKL